MEPSIKAGKIAKSKPLSGHPKRRGAYSFSPGTAYPLFYSGAELLNKLLEHLRIPTIPKIDYSFSSLNQRFFQGKKKGELKQGLLLNGIESVPVVDWATLAPPIIFTK